MSSAPQRTTVRSTHRATRRRRPTLVTTLREDDLSSTAQRERRKRILDATAALASKGGYEAVQMRTVAEHADVAVGTVYRYFPSKVHLLVAALAREFEQFDNKRKPPPSTDPRERMQQLLTQLTRTMQRDPLLTEGMTRAFMFADAAAATEVERVGHIMDRLFARAVTDADEPSTRDLAIARIIGDVWLANLVAWLTRRVSESDALARLELTVALLLAQP